MKNSLLALMIGLAISGCTLGQTPTTVELKHFPLDSLACIIHQRWKGRRTVVGIEDERQELRQIWDGARARDVGSV